MPMDFASDLLIGGRRIRILTIADLWDRSKPAFQVDMSLHGVELCMFLKDCVFKVGCRSVSLKALTENSGMNV